MTAQRLFFKVFAKIIWSIQKVFVTLQKENNIQALSTTIDAIKNEQNIGKSIEIGVVAESRWASVFINN